MNYKKIIHHSNIKLFSDDIGLYKEIFPLLVVIAFDLSKIYDWCQVWQLKLNPLKCEAICISYKRSPPPCSYFLGSQQIPMKLVVKYLGVFINSQLKWSDRVKNITAKAFQSLNYLRHTLFSCSQSIKSIAYKSIVRPILEYPSPVWGPHLTKDVSHLESVQRCAALWICDSRWNTTMQPYVE